MRILPENLEERKWVKRIAIGGFFLDLLGIYYVYKSGIDLILWHGELKIFYFFMYFLVHNMNFLIFGTIIGYISNLYSKVAFSVCFKGVFIIFVIYLIVGFFQFMLYSALILPVLLQLSLMFSNAITCAIGGYVGAKIRLLIKK